MKRYVPRKRAKTHIHTRTPHQSRRISIPSIAEYKESVRHVHLEARNPKERLVRYRIGTESDNGTVEADEHWELRRQQARAHERRKGIGDALGWNTLLLETSDGFSQSNAFLVFHS